MIWVFLFPSLLDNQVLSVLGNERINQVLNSINKKYVNKLQKD